MPNTRDIRRRIKSVKSTSQITKAMQMVAASKMRVAQDMALKGRPFARHLYLLIDEILRRHGGDLPHALFETTEKHAKAPPAVLLLSTDKGLCGALNTNLFREALKLPRETVFVTVGRRASRFCARIGRSLLADFPYREKPGYLASQKISQLLMDKFTAGEVGSVRVLYPRFLNTLVQHPVSVPLLPLRRIEELRAEIGRAAGEKDVDLHDGTEQLDYLYEPDAAYLFDRLLPYYVHFEVYHLLLEAQASEHSARMVAMKSATDNAKSLIKDLTLEYNKVRQAGITNEILEIAAAQLAMES